MLMFDIIDIIVTNDTENAIPFSKELDVSLFSCPLHKFDARLLFPLFHGAENCRSLPDAICVVRDQRFSDLFLSVPIVIM